jgi:hypothetical protein
MKRTELLKCDMVHEDLSSVTVTNRKIQRSIEKEKEEDAKLIHEHCFIPARLIGLNQFATCCITCGNCYCNNCGKLLVNKIFA